MPDKRQDVIDYIPGVKAIKPTDLASYLQSNDTKMVANRIIHRAIFTDVKKAEYIICNTVQQLESETIAALQEKQPVYAIGPLFSPGFTKSSVSTSLWSESDCTTWLDAKPHGSVLYVSFGSYAHTSKDNIMEIASGIVVSDVDFIWVLRPNIVSSEETDYLPIGYEEFIKDRGLIVPWCCQTAVISHPAVGGFLTHCGWNSILEALTVGLPLITWPLFSENFYSEKLLEQLGLGIGVGADVWNSGFIVSSPVVSKEKLELAIKCLMCDSEKSREIRQNAKLMAEKLKSAAEEGGSSHSQLIALIEEIKSSSFKNFT